MLVEAIKERIGTEIDVLSKRIQGAVDLSQLLAKKGMPNVTPWAFVLPLALRTRGDGDAATGAFTQMLDESVAVVLFVGAAGDITGAKSIETLDELIAGVIEAVAGWAPDDAIGVFRLTAGNLLSLNDGLVIYQLDFTIQDQLRIVA